MTGLRCLGATGAETLRKGKHEGPATAEAAGIVFKGLAAAELTEVFEPKEVSTHKNVEPTLAPGVWLSGRRGSHSGSGSGSHNTAALTAGAPIKWLPWSPREPGATQALQSAAPWSGAPRLSQQC